MTTNARAKYLADAVLAERRGNTKEAERLRVLAHNVSTTAQRSVTRPVRADINGVIRSKASPVDHYRNRPLVYEKGGDREGLWLTDNLVHFHANTVRQIGGNQRQFREAERGLLEWNRGLQAQWDQGPENPYTVRLKRKFYEDAALRFGMDGYSTERSVADAKRSMLEHRDSTMETLNTVTPQFDLDEAALYRTAAAPVCNAATHKPLPEYGPSIQAAIITGPIGAGVQAAENENALGSTSISASYAAPSAIYTYISGQEVSIQTVDRLGPNQTYTGLHTAQATREIWTAIESAIVAQLCTNAQQITDNTSASYSVPRLFSDIAQGASLTLGLDGTSLRPTHIFGPSHTLLSFQHQADSEGHVQWEPWGNNTVQGGENDGPTENDTGYSIFGADLVYEDNLPTTTSAGYASILLGAPKESLTIWSSEPRLEIWPTYAQSGGYLVQFRFYLGYANKYPSGWAQLSGEFFGTGTFASGFLAEDATARIRTPGSIRSRSGCRTGARTTGAGATCLGHITNEGDHDGVQDKSETRGRRGHQPPKPL